MEKFEQFQDYDYLVSNYGNVVRIKTGKLISQQKQNSGYFIVCLYKNNKGKTFTVHRLVAYLFIDNPNKYPQVNHIDGIKTNNHYTNLEWCTAKQNSEHAVKNGLFKTYKRNEEQKENTRQWMIKATRGVKKSKEHCERMSRDRKGIMPKCVTERLSKKYIKVKCIETGEIFLTIKDAADLYGINYYKMKTHVCKGTKYDEIKLTFVRL